MTYRIDVDADLCSGYGNCVVAAPDVFDLDPGTNLAVVQEGRPLPTDDPALREAEADCPARAIRLTRR
jgi:ferredoxin